MRDAIAHVVAGEEKDQEGERSCEEMNFIRERFQAYLSKLEKKQRVRPYC
jgi:hypothetical protein